MNVSLLAQATYRIASSRITTSALIALLILPTCKARGATLAFEGVALSGSLRNVNPAAPYNEAGFRLTPSTGQSAVFDSNDVTDMPGNATDWFGFAEQNTISLIKLNGAPFSLARLLVGRSTLAAGAPTTLTIAGQHAGGGSVASSFTQLTTAKTVALNWTNLIGVTFNATADVGIDDVAVDVPEPAAPAIAYSAIFGEIYRRRPRRRALTAPRTT